MLRIIIFEEIFLKISRKKLKPGQVFRLYIGNDVYVFIRNVFIISGSFYLVEIFNYKSIDGIFREEILSAPRLLPIQDIGEAITMTRRLDWDFVYFDKNFTVNEAEISELKFYFNGQISRPNPKWRMENDVWNGESAHFIETIKDENAKKIAQCELPSWDLSLNPFWIFKMVRKALKLAPYEWSSDQEEYDWLIKNKVIRE